MLKLLGRKTSGNVQKVLWLLEELGVPYEREDYGRQFNNTATPEYLALNPNGKVPTLIDGDLVVWESNTILRYLARREDSPLYPMDAAARTEVERWMDWQLGTLNGPFMPIFRGAKTPPAERAAEFAPAEKEFAELAQILDRQLARHAHVAGDALTLADIVFGTTLHRWLSFDVAHGEVPHIRAWYDRVKQRPGFAKHILG